jgi:hypothetical protein
MLWRHRNLLNLTIANVLAIQNSTPAPLIPKAYIIQLKTGSDLLERDEHSQFHKRASDIQYTTRQEFKNPGKLDIQIFKSRDFLSGHSKGLTVTT